MKRGTKTLGALGEAAARSYLQSRGYHILQSNYRCAVGEIDLVAQEGQTLVFVEVKARRSREFGIPEEAITTAKRRKLREVAESYMQEHPEAPCDWRVDLVVLELEGSKRRRIAHIPNVLA